MKLEYVVIGVVALVAVLGIAGPSLTGLLTFNEDVTVSGTLFTSRLGTAQVSRGSIVLVDGTLNVTKDPTELQGGLLVRSSHNEFGSLQGLQVLGPLGSEDGDGMLAFFNGQKVDLSVSGRVLTEEVTATQLFANTLRVSKSDADGNSPDGNVHASGEILAEDRIRTPEIQTFGSLPLKIRSDVDIEGALTVQGQPVGSSGSTNSYNPQWIPVEVPLGPLSVAAKSYSLPNAVPATATEILVNVFGFIGAGSPSNTPVFFTISTREDLTVFRTKFLMYSYPPQNAVSMNSDTFWLPVTSDRKVHVSGSAPIGLSGSGISIMGFR